MWVADRGWLDEATKTIGQVWRRKNARRNGDVRKWFGIIRLAWVNDAQCVRILNDCREVDFSRLPDRAEKLTRGTYGNRDGDVQSVPHEFVGGNRGPRLQIRRTLKYIRRAGLAVQQELHLSGRNAQYGKRRRSRRKREERQRQRWKYIGEVGAGGWKVRHGDVL